MLRPHPACAHPPCAAALAPPPARSAHPPRRGQQGLPGAPRASPRRMRQRWAEHHGWQRWRPGRGSARGGGGDPWEEATRARRRERRRQRPGGGGSPCRIQPPWPARGRLAAPWPAGRRRKREGGRSARSQSLPILLGMAEAPPSQSPKQTPPLPPLQQDPAAGGREDMLACLAALEVALLPCLPTRELPAVDRSLLFSHQEYEPPTQLFRSRFCCRQVSWCIVDRDTAPLLARCSLFCL
ncbi:hypothetical protein BS78_09G093800 [Paspalum vaginatum]|nr:hypothetical protein BS78_09G093800 [Paspalum vaginatum]